MADDAGLPIGAPDGTVQPGPSPASAGMPYAASADAFDKMASMFGGVEQMLDAHRQVVDQANVVRMQSGINSQAVQLAGQYQTDPQGFAQAAAQARSDFLSNQPSRYAIQAGNAWDVTMSARQNQIAEHTFALDHANAGVSLQDGVKENSQTVQSNIATGASLGQALSLPVVQQAIAQRKAGYAALVTGHYLDQDSADFAQAQDRVQDLGAAYRGYLTRLYATKGPQAAWNEAKRFQSLSLDAQPDAAGAPAATAATQSPQGSGTSGAPAALPAAALPASAASSASAPAAGPAGTTPDAPAAPPSGDVAASAQGAAPPAAATPAAATGQAPAPAGGQGAAPAFEDGVPLTLFERRQMSAIGVQALTALDGQMRQQYQLMNEQRTVQQRNLETRMGVEIQHQLRFGQASGGGPAGDEIVSTFGGDRFMTYQNQLTAALKQHTSDGITPDMTDDQIAKRAADSATLQPLDVKMDTPEKIAGLKLAIFGREGGVKGGVPQTSDQGALGTGQLLPGTAVGIAHAHGITALDGLTPAQQSAALLARDQQLNVQLSTLAINDLSAKYGNAAAVAAAYHGGFGYGPSGQVVSGPVEKVIAALTQSGRDPTSPQAWVDQLSAMGMPKTAAYVDGVAKRMKLGQEQAAAAGTVQRDDQITAAAVADPLTFAQEHGLGQVAPLNVQGFASPRPADQQAFATALQQRQQQGAAINAQHPTLPARILTSAEAASYRAVLDRNGGVGVQLADAATKALGTEGAKEFMREIGQTDGQGTVGMQAAQVAASGPNGRRFANDIVDGLNAKNAPGAKPEQLAPGTSWEKTQSAIAPAFAQMDSSQLAATIGTARTAALGQSQHGTPATPDANLRGALGGATNYQTGETFGGIDPNVNGMPVILSPWLKVGAMGSAVQRIAAAGRLGPSPPVYSNGQPLRPADVARLQPQLTSDGTYVLRDPRTNQIARVKGGGAYRLDLEGQKGFLSRLGGYVQAGE